MEKRQKLRSALYLAGRLAVIACLAFLSAVSVCAFLFVRSLDSVLLYE